MHVAPSDGSQTAGQTTGLPTAPAAASDERAPRTTDDPRAVIVLGGGSEIGLAIARELVRGGARTVVLAGRDAEAMHRDAADLEVHARVETVSFDGRAYDSHVTSIEEAFTLAGETQAVILAFAVLGDTDAFEASPTLAGGAASVNFAGGVSASLAAARALARQQQVGQGRPSTLMVLSSTAALRPRQANYVYGATKAGLDFFARGLADSYRERGVRVLIVRPGFVRTRMTHDLPRRPQETTAEAVARDVVRAMRQGASVCWSPGTLRYLRLPIQLAPGWLIRRILGEH